MKVRAPSKLEIYQAKWLVFCGGNVTVIQLTL